MGSLRESEDWEFEVTGSDDEASSLKESLESFKDDSGAGNLANPAEKLRGMLSGYNGRLTDPDDTIGNRIRDLASCVTKGMIYNEVEELREEFNRLADEIDKKLKQ